MEIVATVFLIITGLMLALLVTLAIVLIMVGAGIRWLLRVTSTDPRKPTSGRTR